MKKILMSLAVIVLAAACTKDWDDHYNGDGNLSDNDYTEVLDYGINEFFDNNPEYSKFIEAYRGEGLDAGFSKDQKITLWVVDNDSFDKVPLKTVVYDTMEIMQLQTTLIPWKYDDLSDGLQIISLSGLALKITIEEDGYYYVNYDEEMGFNNNARVIKSYVLNDGNVINQISQLVPPTLTIYDNIVLLGDEFSIIKDSIFAYEVKIFDEENSTVIGINEQGRFVYDTVWITSNELFASAYDPMDPTKDLRVLVPTNEAIEVAIKEVEDMFKVMRPWETGLTQSQYTEIFDWIRSSLVYQSSDFDPNEDIMYAAKGKNYIWRNDIQGVDYSTYSLCNNGRVYTVDYLHIPKYYVILKWFYHAPSYWESERQQFMECRSDGAILSNIGDWYWLYIYGDARGVNAALYEDDPSHASNGWFYAYPADVNEEPGKDRFKNMYSDYSTVFNIMAFYGAADWSRPNDNIVRYPLTWMKETETGIQVEKMLVPKGTYEIRVGGFANLNRRHSANFTVNGTTVRLEEMGTWYDPVGSSNRLGIMAFEDLDIVDHPDNENIDASLRDDYTYVTLQQQIIEYVEGRTTYYIYWTGFYPTENNY
ncbi:MAG: hypothetical protein LIO79_00195 [Rikenellaceae bacterium]|nr:hypothetical protein [Rikenellaceae bacterium]